MSNHGRRKSNYHVELVEPRKVRRVKCSCGAKMPDEPIRHAVHRCGKKAVAELKEKEG